jgi:rubrerythrin
MFKNIKNKSRKSLNISSDDLDSYRCNVCGFPCNKQEVQINSDDDNRDESVDGNQVNYDGAIVDNVTAESGCPLCGSLYSRKK